MCEFPVLIKTKQGMRGCWYKYHLEKLAKIVQRNMQEGLEEQSYVI